MDAQQFHTDAPRAVSVKLLCYLHLVLRAKLLDDGIWRLCKYSSPFIHRKLVLLLPRTCSLVREES